MIKRGSKKADANMMWIVIGLVLALFILVMAIVFFTGGSNKFLEIFRNIFPQKENIDTIKQACDTACSMNAVDAWCKQIRTLNFKIDDKLIKSNVTTCDSWAHSSSLTYENADKTIGTFSQSVKPECNLITC